MNNTLLYIFFAFFAVTQVYYVVQSSRGVIYTTTQQTLFRLSGIAMGVMIAQIYFTNNS